MMFTQLMCSLMLCVTTIDCLYHDVVHIADMLLNAILSQQYIVE